MANQNGKQKAYEPGTLALFAGLGVFTFGYFFEIA